MKEKIIDYIENLESKANDSDKFFAERNNALIEIERLNNIINALKQNELYCVDYETEEDIEKGNKIYIPFNLEEFIQELDKAGSDKE